MAPISDSNTEMALLKQITDLTRQLRAQKVPSVTPNGPSRLYVRNFSGPRQASGKPNTALSKNSRKWCRPVLSKTQLANQQTLQANHRTEIASPAVGRTASDVCDRSKPNNVFVNPNFVPKAHFRSSSVHVNPKRSVLPSGNVHINPNFRSCLQGPAATTGPAGSSSIVYSTPREIGPKVSVPISSVVSDARENVSRQDGYQPTDGGFIKTAAEVKTSTLCIDTPSTSTASTSAASAAVSPGSAARRRRSRSLSSRYRLLTARKLIRRLSNEKKSPRSPALLHARHKLGVAAATLRPKQAAPVVQRSRFKLVRNTTSTPHKSLATARQLRTRPLTLTKTLTGPSEQAAYKTAAPRSQHRVLKRTLTAGSLPGSPAGTAPVRSQHRVLKRTQTAGSLPRSPAGTAPVQSQHRVLKRTRTSAAPDFMSTRVPAASHSRVWRRRNSSGSGQRLISTGVVKFGSDRFVNIGGLLYKSTRRKLQRAAAPSKPAAGTAPVPRRNGAPASSPRAITVRGTRYRVEAGGRSLRRLSSSDVTQTPVTSGRLDIGGVTYRRAADGSLAVDARQQANRAMLSRAKVRSLAVLRDRLRLSRNPCRLYCRTGRCLRHQRHLCPHQHQPELRPVCTRHLAAGGCQVPGCTYNHAPAPEKLPMCLHFQSDECRRERCPYLHVYVDPEAPLCVKFLAGYCPAGQNCPNKHLYICPEFSVGKPCPRGPSCPLLHRARRRRAPRSPPATSGATAAPPRGPGRYYLSVPDKAEQSANDDDDDGEMGEEQEVTRPARKKMAEMPSFIALDSSSEDEGE